MFYQKCGKLLVLFILVIAIAIVSGCTTINNYPATTPTPQVVYVTVTVPVTAQTPVVTPIQTNIPYLSPDDWGKSIEVQVTSNGDPKNPQILTIVRGGTGLNFIQQIDVKVTRSDGIVETGTITKPLTVGKTLELTGTTAPGYRDRAEVWITTPMGDKVKIFDAFVPFRTYN